MYGGESVAQGQNLSPKKVSGEKISSSEEKMMTPFFPLPTAKGNILAIHSNIPIKMKRWYNSWASSVRVLEVFCVFHRHKNKVDFGEFFSIIYRRKLPLSHGTYMLYTYIITYLLHL